MENIIETLKPVRTADDGVSELVGTILLIAITVVLMATLGLFLITNLPSGNPVRAQMEISSKEVSDGGLNEYLILIDEVTERIKLDQIEIDMVLHNYSLPVIVGFNGATNYSQYPIMLKVINTGIYDQSTITLANTSTGFQVYTPENISLAYVSVIDKNINSVIAQTPVKSISSSHNSLNFPVYLLCLKNDTPLKNTLVVTGIGGNKEFNVTNFSEAGMNSNESKFYNNLTSKNDSFPFSLLNSNADINSNLSMEIQIPIFISRGQNLNLTILSTESTSIMIQNHTETEDISHISDNNGSFYLKSFLLSGVGAYFLDIRYEYTNLNGVIAFQL